MTRVNMEGLRRLLIYRLQMNQLADMCARRLRLDKLPPIGQWDLHHHKLVGGHDPMASKIMSVIHDSRIFALPEGKCSGMCGPSYQKPDMYLAYSMMTSGYNVKEAKGLLTQVEDLRWRMDTVTQQWKNTDHAKESLGRLHELVNNAWKISKQKKM